MKNLYFTDIWHPQPFSCPHSVTVTFVHRLNSRACDFILFRQGHFQQQIIRWRSCSFMCLICVFRLSSTLSSCPPLVPCCQWTMRTLFVDVILECSPPTMNHGDTRLVALHHHLTIYNRRHVKLCSCHSNLSVTSSTVCISVYSPIASLVVLL